ncbi:MAG: hypothetical protein HY320_15520, partial [Armatimonadetes bacterium]|nr:hypothetical protein [Armatimonadota bacterium]
DAGARQRYRVCLYTDRPVYRPGHRVRFKGVVRRLETSGYAVPSSPTVLAEVRDEQETVFYRDESALNERGSFAGEFTLPVEARSGYYTLSVRVDGEEHADGFVVASYRKPEWQVVVSTPKRCYVRGERVPVTVHAEYYYGAPVVNAQASYTIYRSPSWSWWDEDQESDFEENEEYSGGYGDVVETGEVTTDQSGNAQFEFGTDLPRDEDRFADYEYNIEIEVTDLSNRSAYGNGSVLVRAGELTLDVRPSRFIAAPGETVPVLARARDLADKPAAGVTLTATAVLLVWDRGREQERPLASQTAQTDARGLARLQMPMEGPGLVLIRLSATDRRGNRIETSTDIWISTAEGGDYARTYPQLSVLLDRKRYRIGDTAQVLVNTDRPGATALLTVEAEGILDVRLVPLRRKSTVVRLPIRAGYEPNVFVTACFVRNREFVSSQARLNVNADAHRLQVTIESDRQVYRPGEAATFQVHTRDVRGRSVSAEFSFGLVDEAIYAIQEGATDSLWQAFYPRRRNAVQTEFSYPEVYLGDASKDGAEVNVRKQFPDTAYWNPFLVTDAAGQATVQIRLPDSLTSWRATVLAHSPQTEVGEARHNIRVMKDLTVRLQAPRSLTEGDRLTLSAVVHNYSARPLDVSVELRAAGLEVQGAAGRRVSLKPDQAEKVHWEAVVGGAGTATLTAIATAGALSDGMQLTAPVRAFARQKIDYRTGVVSGEVAREEFPLDPAAADGSLELRLSPTLAGTLLGSLEYLVHYPYGCTEQTMSSFLPNVVVLQTLRSLGLRRPELEQRVPAMAQAGLVRLYGFQHADGGWGWWEYDKSDPWMTAYVLFGLTVARAAGIEVNRQVYRNGLQAAVQLARGKELSPDNAMFLAYVLTRTPAARRARVLLQRLEEEKPKLHIRSLGYAALALAAIPSGSGQNRRQAKALMEELWRRADHSGGLIRWAETRSARDYGVPPDVESTAVVLKAALALTPRDPRLAGVVRWLLLERHGNRWESTRDTAWILFTLADYLKATGELRPDYRLTVLLNDREIHSKEVRPGDALQEETVLRVPLRPDAVGMAPANRLEVRKSGRGSAYYALEMRQEIRAPRFAAESSSSGLSLQRDYFRLETRRDAAGRPVVVPTEKPGSSVRVGDRILVRLRLHTDRPLEYLILEDPIPAGFEVQERGEVERHEWNYWWSHMDVRDDRVALFVRDVTPGEHTVEYYVRPEVVGTIRVLPAVLSDMYAPATRAATSDSRLEVAK